MCFLFIYFFLNLSFFPRGLIKWEMSYIPAKPTVTIHCLVADVWFDNLQTSVVIHGTESTYWDQVHQKTASNSTFSPSRHSFCCHVSCKRGYSACIFAFLHRKHLFHLYVVFCRFTLDLPLPLYFEHEHLQLCPGVKFTPTPLLPQWCFV